MEVRSETGIMSSREPPFTVNLQKNNSVQSPPSSMQNVRLLFGSDGPAVYKQVPSSSPPPPTSYPATTTATGDDNTGGGGGGGGDGGAPQPFAGHGGLNMNMGEPVKRKRGRPRKYGPDGSMPFVLSPVPSASAPPSHASLSSGGLKKAKVRPPGSGKKHLLASLGSAGTGFTPHIITVKTGEDVSSKIMSFLQHGPRAVCVLSANGAISNVTLRQATISGGTVTYEGRFEILSLSGSFLLSESGGQRSRTGGLSVSLAGPDGRVLGGGVAGILTAASPVQVVAGSFMVDGGKETKKSASQLDLSYDAKLPPVVAPVRNGSPNSHGTQSESSGGGPGSPFHHSTGGCSNGNQNQQTMPNNIPWK